MFDLLLSACRDLVDCHELAHELGLCPAKERHKWACPQCSSSDALHIYQGPGRGGYCFSCAAGVDAIALTQQMTGLPFSEAVGFLADRFGFSHLRSKHCGPSHDHEAIERRKRVQEAVDARRMKRDKERTERHQRARFVLTSVFNETTLGPTGQDHLERRGIPEEAYRHLGLRSVETRDEWGSILRLHDEADLETAGLMGRGSDGGTYPVPWRFPVLVIPFLYRSHRGNDHMIDLLRFRDLSEHPNTPRYLSPLGLSPTDPWGWNCYVPRPGETGIGETLYVCEGEINAISMQVASMPAIGCPGASVWREEWAAHCRYWPKVVVVGDHDDAGEKFCARVESSFRRQHTSIETVLLKRDPSDLLRDGELCQSAIRG